MCSIGDDNLEDLDTDKYLPEKTPLSSFDKCNKCREESPCIVLRSKDKYCKGCFLSATVHKFKAILGKHRLIRPNDKVLVLHKAGHPSTALLHFIRTGLDLATHKKLRFEPVFLFIENYTHLSVGDRTKLCKDIEEEVTTFGFPIYFASFPESVDDLDQLLVQKSVNLNIQNDDGSKLFLQKCSKTNTTDYYNIKIRELSVKIAKHLGCKFMFTPELSMDVAAQLLTDLSLGRGSQIPLDTGFCDDRDDDLKILRPLRLFDTKELVFYNHYHKLTPVTYQQIKDNPYSSVQTLMTKFVTDLQVNYPATVTTVLKTGDKLAKPIKSANNKCSFCKAPIQEENYNLSSAESTKFSSWVSNQPPDYDLDPQERYTKVLESFNNLTCNSTCFACTKLGEFVIIK